MDEVGELTGVGGIVLFPKEKEWIAEFKFVRSNFGCRAELRGEMGGWYL